MDILTVSAIIAVSVVLLMFCCIVFIKVFGKGVFWGTDLTAAVVFDHDSDVNSTLYEITESALKEFECSGNRIVIVDAGMDMGQLEVCRRFCRKYSVFTMSTPDELGRTVCEIQGDKKEIFKKIEK